MTAPFTLRALACPSGLSPSRLNIHADGWNIDSDIPSRIPVAGEEPQEPDDDRNCQHDSGDEAGTRAAAAVYDHGLMVLDCHLLPC